MLNKGALITFFLLVYLVGKTQETIGTHSNPLFVVTFENKKLDKSEVDSINANIRIVFDRFWDLNDTIIYINKREVTAIKKLNQFSPVINFHPTRRNSYRISYMRPPLDFMNYSLIFYPDTDLLYMITAVRRFHYNFKSDCSCETEDLGPKIILINKDETTDPYHEDYRKKFTENFSESIMEVTTKELISILITKSKKYLYVYHARLVNVEDGRTVRAFADDY